MVTGIAQFFHGGGATDIFSNFIMPSPVWRMGKRLRLLCGRYDDAAASSVLLHCTSSYVDCESMLKGTYGARRCMPATLPKAEG